MVARYTPEQISDTECLAKVISKIPEEKRMLVTMSALAFVSGMEVRATIEEQKKERRLNQDVCGNSV